MTKPKYSMLIMRDDKDVRRYRVSPFMLKSLVYLQIVLVLLAGGGVYVGYSFWHKTQSEKRENRVLQKQLAETRRHLERLENVDKILQSNDPEELQSLFGSVAVEAEPHQPPAPKVDLNDIFAHVNLQQAGVDNLQAKLTKGQMRVRFDLNNLQTDKALSGFVNLSLVLRDGNIAEVNTRRSDMRFSIHRFKRVRTTFSLPKGVDVKNIYGLRIGITRPEGETVFRETYPISQILS